MSGQSCFVYILQCADKTFYTGWTVDPGARLQAHNSGKGAKYTRGRLPVRLVYLEAVPDKPAALRREYAIKRLTRGEKLSLIRRCAQGGAAEIAGESGQRKEDRRAHDTPKRAAFL